MKKNVNKNVQKEVHELLMLLPESVFALARGLLDTARGVKKPPLTSITIDDPVTYKPVLHAISSMLVFKVLAASTVVNARVILMMEIYKGDTGSAARAIGTIQSVGAITEFMIGPLLGRLSDRLGRKAVMLSFPALEMMGNLLVLLQPHSLTAHWCAMVPTIALGTAFFSTMRAMMADVMSGRNIAENGFIHMAPAGIATMAAPLLAARFSTLGCYRLAIAFGALCSLVLFQLQETNIRTDKPVHITWESCNPLAFYRLFTSGPELRSLALVSGLQTYTDPRILEDNAVLSMRDKLGWDDAQVVRVSAQLSTMAVSMFVGVPFGKYTIRSLGRMGFTHWAHFWKVCGYFTWAMAGSSRSMKLAQFFLMFGQRQRDGVETLMTDIGAELGMGKGQLESYKMNWRSVSNLVAPLIYGRVFAAGKKRGVLGAPFFVAALFVVLSELGLLVGVGKLNEDQLVMCARKREEARKKKEGAVPKSD